MQDQEPAVLLECRSGLVRLRGPVALPVLRGALRQLLDDDGEAAAAPAVARITRAPRAVPRRAGRNGDAAAWRSLQARVRSARVEAGLGWQELAERVGLGASTVKAAVGRSAPASPRITGALQRWLDGLAEGAPAVAPNTFRNGAHPAERDAA